MMDGRDFPAEPYARANPPWYAGILPTFQDMRAEAYRLLGDAQDTLRSDWLTGTGPTQQQATALTEARRAIAAAKTALDRAAE
ncbi:MAG TPA: hypothetical protein VHU91_01210 [Mycobacteriales bacterium]|jgi:hypothetical protein|nr:hypothetical protein [Mycobacteriales bacterium]